jgi:hypothetical protein
LKEEALYHTLCRTRFGRSYGPVVRQTADWMKNNQKFYILITNCSIRLLWISEPTVIISYTTSLSYLHTIFVTHVDEHTKKYNLYL